MNLKVLFVVFLCFFSAFIICNAATVMLNVPDEGSCKAGNRAVNTGYLINNGTEPMGDPIVDPGWP